MIGIRTLGVTSITLGDGVPANGILCQPRRTALLAYLVMGSTDAPTHREHATELFWGDRPQHAARTCLRQALHFLRESLGSDAIVSEGPYLRVSRIACDANDFLRAHGDGRWIDAAELYAGQFMPSFVCGVDAVDDWIQAKRGILRTMAADAAWKSSEQLTASGDAAGAVHYAIMSSMSVPESDVVACRAMRFLLEAGRSHDALLVFERHRSHLAEHGVPLSAAADQLRLRAAADAIECGARHGSRTRRLLSLG